MYIQNKISGLHGDVLFGMGIFKYIYHISDMIPVALPPCVAGAGLTRSLFLFPRTLDSTVHCVSSLTSINTVMYAGQVSLVDRSSCNRR